MGDLEKFRDTIQRDVVSDSQPKPSHVRDVTNHARGEFLDWMNKLAGMRPVHDLGEE